MPGVQPVEAAGDDNLFAARLRMRARGKLETFQLGGRDDPVAEAGGKAVWRVKILSAKGEVRIVVVDAASGRVVG